MKRLLDRRPARTATLALALVAGMFAAATAPQPAQASEPATLGFHCTFPLLGPQPLQVKVTTSLPETIPAGQPTPAIDIEAVSTIAAETTPGLVAVGAARLEGTAEAKAAIAPPGGSTLNLSVPVALKPTPVPPSGAFDLVATARIAPISFAQPGTATVTLQRMVLTITPRLADGRTTGLDTFDADCLLDEGQDGVVARVKVTEGDTPPDPPGPTYGLSGSSVLKKTQATVPLGGAVEAEISGATIAADLTLKPTSTSFNVFGFLPVTAQVTFTPEGRTTGTIGAQGVSTRSKVTVAVPSITTFGFPIGGGSGCHTQTPADIPLAATMFDPAKGGTLTGTYTLPPFADCGGFTPMVNALVAGPGNTLTAVLATQ